jgi:hypothetical protein
MSFMNQLAPRLLVVSVALLGSTARAALFDKTSPVGAGVGHVAGTFGFYFTPRQDVYVSQLGAFNYSFYTSGSAVVEIWKQGAATPEASATIALGGSSQQEADFNYVFSSLSEPWPTLTAGVHYLVVWKDNLGSSAQPFADGSHSTVNGPVADYDVPVSGPGLITLNYSYIFSGSSLAGINPWDEQHVAGWEKSVISGSPAYMDVNLEVIAVPEPVETGAAVGLLLLGVAWGRRVRA